MNSRKEEIRGDFLEMLHAQTERFMDSLYDDLYEDLQAEAEINRFPLEDCEALVQDTIELITHKLVNTGVIQHQHEWLLLVVDKYVDILASIWADLDHAHNRWDNWVCVYVDFEKHTTDITRKPDHIHVQIVDVQERLAQHKIEIQRMSERPLRYAQLYPAIEEIQERLKLVKEVD